MQQSKVRFYEKNSPSPQSSPRGSPQARGKVPKEICITSLQSLSDCVVKVNKDDIPTYYNHDESEHQYANKDLAEYAYSDSAGESGDETPQANICQECKKKRVSSGLGNSNAPEEVVTVLCRLQDAKLDREREAYREKINEISERVTAAIEHCELDIDDSPAAGGTLNMHEEKKKLKSRRLIDDTFATSGKLSKMRDDTMQDVENGLRSITDELAEFCDSYIFQEMPLSEEHFHRMNKALKRSVTSITRLAKFAQNFRKPKKKKGQNRKETPVGSEREASPEIRDSDSIEGAPTPREKVKTFRKVYTEKELEDKNNLKQTFKIMTAILDDGASIDASSKQLRSNFNMASKQTTILSSYMERKMDALIDKEAKIKHLMKETEQMKQLKEQRKNLNLQVSKLTDENKQLKESVEQMTNKVSELTTNATTVSSQHHRKVSINVHPEEYGTVRGSLYDNESSSNLLHLCTSPVSLSRHSAVEVRAKRSAIQQGSNYNVKKVASTAMKSKEPDSNDSNEIKVEQKLHEKSQEDKRDLRKSLVESDTTCIQQLAEIEELKKLNAQLQQQSLSSTTGGDLRYEKKMAEFEKKMAKLQNEFAQKADELSAEKKKVEQLRLHTEQLVADKGTLEQELEKEKIFNVDIKDLPRDQLLNKMKAQSDRELQRLRNYIVKEQQRFQANLRKINLEHNQYVSGLRNEKAQMLRALMSFKTVVSRFLYDDNSDNDRNNDSAGEHDELFCDNDAGEFVTTEPIFDMIVTLHKNLNKAFLQKRLKIKQANTSKATAEKSLKKYRNRLQKVSDDRREQERVSKCIAAENTQLRDQQEQLKRNNKDLQKEIAPCKQLLDKYNCVRKELDHMTCEDMETKKHTKELVKEFEEDRSRLRKELQMLSISQIKHLESMNSCGGRITCRKKINLVNKAFEENRISAVNQDIAKQVLSSTSDVIQQQLSDFLWRYVEFKRVERVKGNMAKLSREIAGDTRFLTYWERIEKRHAIFQQNWKEKMHELASIKEKAFLVFNELLRYQSELQVTAYPSKRKSATKSSRSRFNVKMLQKKSPNEVLEEIIGERINIGNYGESYWQMPPEIPNVFVSTPKIMELDVNNVRRKPLQEQRNRQVHLPPIATLFP